MSNTSASLPVSEIIKKKSKNDNDDEEPKKKSREDWRKAKELEEARKAGTAPAAVDEEGKDINPHIPQYISSTPWYYGSSTPTLKHQRPQTEKKIEHSKLNECYIRGINTKKISTKWTKGACENCGAKGHIEKDCFEAKRARPAKFGSKIISPDDHVQPKLNLDYDGKRDRWSGYDVNEYVSVVEEHKKIENVKIQMKTEQLSAQDNDQDSDKDEDKYVDEVDMPGTKVDSKQRITVRNLRIREDTAKYLRNLNPNSAYYDPKTRSMRDNPHQDIQQEVDYQGENFVRFSGDTQKHATAQLFAWEAYEKGVDVHLLAEPTKLEMLHQEYDKKKDELKNKAHGSVIDKYGGKEYLEKLDPSLVFSQSEVYIEYSRAGKIIKGQEKQPIRSSYEEDVYPNNHKSVWGSFWQNGKWGFACCHSFIKNSYCTGEAGKEALASSQIICENKAFNKPTDVELNKSNHDDDDDDKKFPNLDNSNNHDISDFLLASTSAKSSCSYNENNDDNNDNDDDNNRLINNKNKNCTEVNKKLDISKNYNNADDDDNDDSYGPILPPNINEKIPDKKIIGPYLPECFKKQIEENISKNNDDDDDDEKEEEEDTFGPALPPHLASKNCEALVQELPVKMDISDSVKDVKNYEEDDEDDDGCIGPLPVNHPALQDDLVQQQLEYRARMIKRELAEIDNNVDEKKREEWMTELPAVQTAHLGLVPRSFRSRPGPDMSDRSSWTDTPADRAKKQREKILMIGNTSKDKEPIEHEIIEKPNKRKEKTLMEMHQKKLHKKKKKEEKEAKEAGLTMRRPFDRDIDMQVNRFDESRNKTILRKAASLDDRFSRGKM